MKKINNIVKVFLGFSGLLLSNQLFAQQDAMFTHYMYNTLAVNSGYAGSREALTVTGLHRSQWLGIEGAPITQTLTLHTPIFRNDLGVGFSLVNDQIGPTNTTAFYADVAYRLKFKSDHKLSLGLKAGGNLRQGSLSTLKVNEQGDQSFNNVQTQFLPNFGFGAYYYTTTWYVGLSMPKLLENKFLDEKNGAKTNLASEKRHYFFIAGTVFPLSSKIKLKPTTFVKVTEGAPVEADLTATFLLYDMVSIGAMLRTGDAIGVLAGYQITNQLAVGYSFDWSYALATGKYNGGSHEIMLRYDFIFNDKEKIKSPRYF